MFSETKVWIHTEYLTYKQGTSPCVKSFKLAGQPGVSRGSLAVKPQEQRDQGEEALESCTLTLCSLRVYAALPEHSVAGDQLLWHLASDPQRA